MFFLSGGLKQVLLYLILKEKKMQLIVLVVCLEGSF